MSGQRGGKEEESTREADLTQGRRRRRRRGMRTGKSVQLTRRLVRRRQSACDRRGEGRIGLNSHLFLAS